MGDRGGEMMVINTLCKGLGVHWVEGRDGQIDRQADRQKDGLIDERKFAR